MRKILYLINFDYSHAWIVFPDNYVAHFLHQVSDSEIKTTVSKYFADDEDIFLLQFLHSQVDRKAVYCMVDEMISIFQEIVNKSN